MSIQHPGDRFVRTILSAEANVGAQVTEQTRSEREGRSGRSAAITLDENGVPLEGAVVW